MRRSAVQRFLPVLLRVGVCLALVLVVAAQAGQSGRPRPVAGVAADPAAVGQWGGLMNWPLVAVHTSLLHTGQILTWDAWETGGTPSVRLWDPATNAFTPVPNQTSQIFCSAHAQLPDGRLMVVGGHNGGEVGITATNVFDPATSGWSLLPSMSYARWYPSLTRTGDEHMVAVSGQITQGNYADTPETYTAASHVWTKVTGASSSFAHDDGYPLSFELPNGRLFVFDPEGGHLGVLDLATGRFSALPDSPIRFGSAAMYRPGKILVSGGGDAWSAPTNGATEVIDMTAASPTWQQTAPMTYGRYQHNLVVLADGQVLAIGGSADVDQADLNGALPAELWNPQTQTWTTVAALSNPRMYHSTALLLPDATVLAAGGGRWSTAKDYATAEIYSPPYLFKGARPTITSAPSSAAYAGTMTVQTPDAAGIASVALVGLGSVTHTLDMDQRYVPLSFTASGGALSVQAPVDPNLAPPGYYMLFIVNGNGVPSVASIVQLARVPDSQPPAVSVTTPAAGDTLSGTAANLAATASDNVGVAGVQFLVDGAPVGSPVTAPPYTLAWDSTAVADGSHTVAARAWDAAGNTATSAGIAVTVSNPSPPSISGIRTGSVSASGAAVSWTTDKMADSQVEYGTTTAYGSSTTTNPTLVESHSQALTGLAAATNYHFRVRSRDASGRLSVSADATFTTAAAPPSFRSMSNVTNGTTASAPAGVAAGDLLLAAIEVDTDPVTVTPPAGWTRLVDRLVGQGSAAFHAELWYRVAGASEPASYKFTPSSGAWVDIGLLDYRNVNGAAPIDAFAARDAGVTNTPTSDSITTTAPNDLVVALFQDFNFGTWTPGPGMTARYDFDSNLAEDALQVAAGPTGVKTATDTASGQSAAMIVALKSQTADTEPPTVGVTAPAAGTTVSGTSVALSATASDNVGVTAVQFSVDGADVGPRLTTLPYTFAWDSTGAANGAHTIAARAWDAAGNVGAAAGVSVTVSNAPPPAISGVGAGSVTTTGATISWQTDVGASSQVDYGTTTAYGSSTTADGSLVTSHAQTLSGLAPATQYHYRVRSAGSGTAQAVSGDFTFTTATPPPPVISNVSASAVTATAATIEWTTDTPSDTTVEYGTTTAYGASAAAAGLVTGHTQGLTGLGSGTVYHYRVKSRDAYGQVSTSGDGTFTTASAVPTFRSRSTTTNGSTVTRPAGAVAGDLLLAALEVDADPVTVTGPAGWTLLQDVRIAPGTASVYHAQLWYRVAGASEPSSYAWSASVSAWTDIGVLDYANVNGAAPIDVSAAQAAGTTSTPATPQITTAYANDLMVAVFVDYNFGTWTAGSGMTQRFDFDSVTAQDALLPSSGPVGPKTATSTTTGPTAALVVALRSP